MYINSGLLKFIWVEQKCTFLSTFLRKSQVKYITKQLVSYPCPDHTMFFQKSATLMALSFAKLGSFPVQLCLMSVQVSRCTGSRFLCKNTEGFCPRQYSPFLQVFSAPRGSCAKSVECSPDWVWEVMSWCQFLFLLADWVFLGAYS